MSDFDLCQPKPIIHDQIQIIDKLHSISVATEDHINNTWKDRKTKWFQYVKKYFLQNYKEYKITNNLHNQITNFLTQFNQHKNGNIHDINFIINKNIMDIYNSILQIEKTNRPGTCDLVSSLKEKIDGMTPNAFIYGYMNSCQFKKIGLPSNSPITDLVVDLDETTFKFKPDQYDYNNEKNNPDIRPIKFNDSENKIKTAIVNTKLIHFLKDCREKGIKIHIATHGDYDKDYIKSLFDSYNISIENEIFVVGRDPFGHYDGKGTKTDWMNHKFKTNKKQIALMDDNYMNIKNAKSQGFSVLQNKEFTGKNSLSKSFMNTSHYNKIKPSLWKWLCISWSSDTEYNF